MDVAPAALLRGAAVDQTPAARYGPEGPCVNASNFRPAEPPPGLERKGTFGPSAALTIRTEYD